MFFDGLRQHLWKDGLTSDFRAQIHFKITLTYGNHILAVKTGQTTCSYLQKVYPKEKELTFCYLKPLFPKWNLAQLSQFSNLSLSLGGNRSDDLLNPNLLTSAPLFPGRTSASEKSVVLGNLLSMCVHRPASVPCKPWVCQESKCYRDAMGPGCIHIKRIFTPKEALNIIWIDSPRI